MKFRSRRIAMYLFLWTILIALVSSCSFKVERLNQPLVTIPPPPTVLVNTDTPIPLPTIDIISTLTAQPTPELSLEPDCIPIEDNIPDDLALSGVWVRNLGKPYLEPMDGSTAYGVPLKGGGTFSNFKGDMAISPDGRYLAYIDSYLDDSGKHTKSRILRIIKSSGRSLPMDYWPLDWQEIIGWVDNQNLALSIGKEGIIILNPFTGNWKKFQPEWLDDDYGWSSPYIPPLDWFVDDSTAPHLFLRDVKTESIIWQTDHGGGFTWSADGSTVAVYTRGFIDIISKDGQATEFDIRRLNLDFWPAILAPNGQKLVFQTSSTEHLFFDLKKPKINKLCNDRYELRWGGAPFWSPDSRFIVLGVYDSKAYPTFDQFDILIDTELMHAYKLTSGQYQGRLAWLAEP